MDSVALSIASGAKCKDINAARALKIALVFGFFQALMPFLGYFLGLAFVNFIASVDHFVAFAILAFLGFKMIKEARELKENEACLTDFSVKFLIAGALATSIDALAVGVTFSFENIDILYSCFLIGAVCFALCVLACYVGKFLGVFLEKKALILGGVILIGLSVKILITHLMDHGFLNQDAKFSFAPIFDYLLRIS